MEYRPLEALPIAPLLTPEFDVDPTGVYDKLRDQYGPVAPVDFMGVPVWLVLGYTEVLDVLRDREVWRRDIRHWRARRERRLPPGWPMLPAYEMRHTMFLDGDEHDTARRVLHAALAPFRDTRSMRAQDLRSTVIQFADELIGVLAADSGRAGNADLSAQYIRPLLLMFMNQLYGLPQQLGDDIVLDMWRMLDGGRGAGEANGRVLAAMTELAAYKRKNPGPDLPTSLFESHPTMSDEEMSWELLMNAVYITDVTGNLIANTVLELLRGNTGARTSLSAGLIGETVNRAALASPPVANLTYRFPACDVELGEFLIRTGDMVMASPWAAHGDPLFSTGVASSTTISTRAHLAWGAGHHQCPSASRELGTMLVVAAVERLFHHFARVSITMPFEELPWRSGAVVRGLRFLPVRYELSENSSALLRHGAPPGGLHAVFRGAAAATAPSDEPPAVPPADDDAPPTRTQRLVTAIQRLMARWDRSNREEDTPKDRADLPDRA
ncbi:cytochrome [Streptomyces sp. NPDC087850]|uniref:cytochrome n=1 Tax=unclassified Streptomyces TaxID=2593676 RepID=UPI003805A1FB